MAAYASTSICFLLSLVQSVGFLQQQDKPVNLWSQNRQIAHVAVQRQVEGHPVHGNPKLPSIHPVHEGEDQDAACEETQEDHDAVDVMQPGIIKAQLQVQFYNIFEVLLQADIQKKHASKFFSSNFKTKRCKAFFFKSCLK